MNDPPIFNPNDAGVYAVALSAFARGAATDPLASAGIDVAVVPVPVGAASSAIS